MTADHLVDAVIDGPEQPGPPILFGGEPGRVRASDHVRSVGDNAPVVSEYPRPVPGLTAPFILSTSATRP